MAASAAPSQGPGQIVEEPVQEDRKIDVVIIVSTGLGDPAPVAQTFVDEEISQLYRLDGIVTVIDSKHILQTSTM